MQLKDVCPIELKDNSHLVRLLHILAAAEEEAIVQYEQVLAALPANSYRNVYEALQEIKKDELNHTGILIDLISKLAPEEGQAMIEGARDGD